jgi:hypothetical protein
MFRELTDELLDLQVRERGFRRALYAKLPVSCCCCSCCSCFICW